MTRTTALTAIAIFFVSTAAQAQTVIYPQAAATPCGPTTTTKYIQPPTYAQPSVYAPQQAYAQPQQNAYNQQAAATAAPKSSQPVDPAYGATATDDSTESTAGAGTVNGSVVVHVPASTGTAMGR